MCECDDILLHDDGLHWISSALYGFTGQPIPPDIGVENINPVLVEQSIPITMQMQYETGQHSGGGGTGSSFNTDSNSSSSQKRPVSRPTSLLVREHGLVRFRQEGDDDDNVEPVILSTEDELDLQDPDVMGRYMVD